MRGKGQLDSGPKKPGRDDHRKMSLSELEVERLLLHIQISELGDVQVRRVMQQALKS